MFKEDSQLLIALVKQRIQVLKGELGDSQTNADKKLTQSDDPDAILDIAINTLIDEKLTSEHKLELAQLIQNLNWLQSEDAGFCDSCGCEIPMARLKVVHTTRHCVSCADTLN